MEILDSKMNCVFSELQSLADGISKDVERQSKIAEKFKEVDELSERVKQMRKKRSEILTKKQTASLCRQVVTQAAQIEREKKLQHIISAQKFTGISANVPEPGRLKFSFETTNKGKYCGSFVWEVLFINETIKTCWHNIPSFISLSACLSKYNNHEIKLGEMIHEVHSLLTAYVRRREEVIELADTYSQYLEDTIGYSQAFDLIQLKCRFSNQKSNSAIIQLIYENFCSILPTSVLCKVSDQSLLDKSQIERAFATAPMINAFQTVLLEE